MPRSPLFFQLTRRLSGKDLQSQLHMMFLDQVFCFSLLPIFPFLYFLVKLIPFLHLSFYSGIHYRDGNAAQSPCDKLTYPAQVDCC